MSRSMSGWLAGCLLIGGLVVTGSGQDYSIDWYTVDGGGGTSSGGGYVLSGTIGQADAGGPFTGGDFALTGGFWSGAVPVCTTFAIADLDQDCDVDADDFALFAACFTGPDLLYDPENLPSGCTLTPDQDGIIAADFNGNGAVDQTDFAVLQRCFSGTNIPANPLCGQ